MSTGWAVGLDIGGTKVDGVLLDPSSTVRGTLRAATVRGTDGVVACAAQVVRELVAATGISAADLMGVGVGVPGLVDPRTGSVSHAVNLGMDLSDVPLGALLTTALGGVPARVENDVNAAALGAAHLLGLGADLAYLALGTGVAAGVVLDGRLRRGFRGGAGEIGHVPYELSGPLCACGQHGCLELYASGSAVARQWPSDDPLPVRALFDAAASGDAVAAAVRDRLLQGAAEAARLLVLTVDVDDVVIGGGISRLGEPLIAGVRGIIARWEADSPFVASLRLGERVRLLTPDFPAAAVGAAFVGDPEANAVEVV